MFLKRLFLKNDKKVHYALPITVYLGVKKEFSPSLNGEFNRYFHLHLVERDGKMIYCFI